MITIAVIKTPIAKDLPEYEYRVGTMVNADLLATHLTYAEKINNLRYVKSPFLCRTMEHVDSALSGIGLILTNYEVVRMKFSSPYQELLAASEFNYKKYEKTIKKGTEDFINTAFGGVFKDIFK